MNPLRNATNNEVRGRLLLRGSSVDQFAREIGVPVQTVYTVIRRFSMSDRTPHGEITKRVLRKLAPYMKPDKGERKCA